MLLYRRQKMRQAIQRGIPRKADAAKTGSFTKSPGKEAQSVIAIIRLNQGENFSPNPPTQWVKKRYPLFFRKYEIHKGRHLYRTHKKAGILQCTCRLKKIQIILTEKFNRSITCTNAEMKPGRGGKSFFPPTKDIGTSVGDCVGKGKYFPLFFTF